MENHKQGGEMQTQTESPTKELLSEIHRNLEMGSDNLTSVVPKISDKFFLAEVTNQLEEYAGYTKQTLEWMETFAVRPEKSGIGKVAMARGGIAMNTLLDDSDSHIADMIQRGTRMGADTLEKTISRLSSGDSDVVDFGNHVVAFERNCANRVTEFL